MNPASLGDLPAVLAWAERRAPGARVAGCAVRPLAGGAVARRVDQVTLHLTGQHEPLELVCKQASAHEIAGLRAAQAVRQETTAIPELVAWASDWLITPLAPGSPLAWGDAVPASLFDALAALHARYHRAASLPVRRVRQPGQHANRRSAAGQGRHRRSASGQGRLRPGPPLAPDPDSPPTRQCSREPAQGAAELCGSWRLDFHDLPIAAGSVNCP